MTESKTKRFRKRILEWRWLAATNEKLDTGLAWFARRFPRSAKFAGIIRSRRRPVMILLKIALHTVGFFMSIQAVMQTRTEQGAVAWALSLNTVPIIAVPAWMIFGDSHIDGYLAARRAGLEEVRPIADQFIKNLEKAEAPSTSTNSTMETLEALASIPAMKGNKAELLIDGKNTYKSIFDAVEQAEKYILVQFFILRSDATGGELKQRLLARAREGVRVYVLVDDVGCLHLPQEYYDELRNGGVHIRKFMGSEDGANRFQLNFRNHRKIVVVDGNVAFLGGHNIGDEYLGEHPTLTPWRDSHMRLTGPIVKAVQIPFIEDWHWATGELIKDLDWEITADDFVGQMEAVCLASGPADPVETCSMFFLTAINNAKERVWISTPYFVPDKSMVTALQLAAIRGVDVRVIMPKMVDSKLVYYSSYSYLGELETAGVKLYRYTNGFIHQKVVVVDDDISAIGSANFDNRSFRLNFEVTGIIHDTSFNSEVAKMMSEDMENSVPTGSADFDEKSFAFRLTSRLARLLSPIQ